MRIISIGSKLTLWYTGLLTLTFLLLGTIAYGLLTYSLSRDMDYALNGMGNVMAEKAKAEGKTFYPGDVDELFRRFFGFSPLERHFDIFDPKEGFNTELQGRHLQKSVPLSSEALENAAQGKSSFETVTSTGSYPIRVLTVPVIESGRLTNLVRVGMSLENMYKTRRRFLLVMAALFPLVLLLAGGGGWLLARRALSPVDQMTQSAQKISGEHLNQRLQGSGSGDELDRLATTLNEMLDRFHNAIAQMRQFSADASHELQTPLTILKGEMEVALRQKRSPEEYMDVLASGLEEIDRINHLVEGLLLIARADSGILRLDRQRIYLKELLADIFQQIRSVADQHAIQLILEAHESVTVEGDREHLRRLFLNLLGNAIKYSYAGGVVTVALLRDKKWAVVKVTDTGMGISADEQKQIFNRFYRATQTGARDGKGAGLGLSIVDSIVKTHNGYIAVKSSPKQGSTFTVHLPVLSSPR